MFYKGIEILFDWKYTLFTQIPQQNVITISIQTNCKWMNDKTTFFIETNNKINLQIL